MVNVNTLFNIFDILGQLLYFGHSALFLNFFDEIFLHGDNLSSLQILRKLNIFKQPSRHVLLLLIDEASFLLENLKKRDKLAIRITHRLESTFRVASLKLIVDKRSEIFSPNIELSLFFASLS